MRWRNLSLRCQVLRTWQLSPIEKEEDNSMVKNSSIVNHNIVIVAFRHGESKFGIKLG